MANVIATFVEYLLSFGEMIHQENFANEQRSEIEHRLHGFDGFSWISAHPCHPRNPRSITGSLLTGFAHNYYVRSFRPLKTKKLRRRTWAWGRSLLGRNIRMGMIQKSDEQLDKGE